MLNAISRTSTHASVQTAGVLTEGLLPQLSALRAELAARTAHAVEQEALVSALIEELEEIADDVAGVNVKQAYLAGAHPGADGDAPKKRAHEMLEDGLTELLKRTQGKLTTPGCCRRLLLSDAPWGWCRIEAA